MSVFLRLINIPAMLSHLWLRRKRREVHDPENDLELALYANLFENNFLHYGYFDPPPQSGEDISLRDIKNAMENYADLLCSRVKPGEKIIEIGCGMGGLLAKFDKMGANVSAVTPDESQIKHISKNWPHIPLYKSTLERLDTQTIGKFDVVVNSESFQYIDIRIGIEQIKKLLAKNGRWIVSDYFLINPETHNKSGHILSDFLTAIDEAGLQIVERIDITDNVLPTLKYAHTLATRLALPIIDFGVKKFFLRHPFFEYLLAPIIDKKQKNIRLDTIDAEIFKRDKIYLLLVLKRK